MIHTKSAGPNNSTYGQSGDLARAQSVRATDGNPVAKMDGLATSCGPTCMLAECLFNPNPYRTIFDVWCGDPSYFVFTARCA
jgi:hypothetical protein